MRNHSKTDEVLLGWGCSQTKYMGKAQSKEKRTADPRSTKWWKGAKENGSADQNDLRNCASPFPSPLLATQPPATQPSATQPPATNPPSSQPPSLSTNRPPVSRQERRKKEKEWLKRRRKAPPLSVDAVTGALGELAAHWRDVGECLGVPDSTLSTIAAENTADKECLRAAVRFFLYRCPIASWRQIIGTLDGMSCITDYESWHDDLKRVRNKVRPHTEKLTDRSFTYKAALASLTSLRSSDDVGNLLSVPDARIEELSNKNDSLRREELVKYHLEIHPQAGWHFLLGRLLQFEETVAFEVVKEKMKLIRDPTFTITSLTQLLTSVQDWDDFRSYLCIPGSKYKAIKRQFSDGAERVRALCEWYLTNHPAPSWTDIALGLYDVEEHALLDVVRRHYLKGTQQYRNLLREAMNDGHVQSQISKILLYGAAGTGKSSFMDIVIDNPPATLRRSTSLAARPVTIFHVGMAGQQWEKLSPQQQKEVLVKAAIRKSIEDDQREESSSEEDICSDVENTREEGAPGSSETNSTQHQASAQNTGADAASSTQNQTSQPSQQDTPDSTPDTTFDNLVLLAAEYSKTGESITTYRKLYLVDSGGQPQFHEMLPVFLRRMTLYVFVFKLSEELSTKPMVEYYDQSGEPVGTPYQSSHTNQQHLEHCLRTLRTHRPSPDSQTKSSKIMVIGTHRDKEDPENRKQERARKNEKISELLIPSFQEEVVYYNLSTEEFIFPVNARNPQHEDRAVVSKFRQLILTKCIPQPVDVPLRYYALEIVLEEYSQKVGRGVLSIDECLEAASELQFDRHTLEAALIFLDELSAVFYFPEILGGVLFTNPQVLLDKVTELVEMVHAIRKDCCELSCLGNMKTFRDHAQISLEFLSEFQKHYVPNLFTPVELVKLFKELFILAELSSEKFFMPALLQVLQEEKLTEYCVSADSLVAALAINFEQGPRLGVYCTLSCFLVSSDNVFPSPWKIKLLPKSTTPFCLYRNCIRFSIPGCSGSVTLVDTFTHFEVHVSTQQIEECVKVCSLVRSAILAGLKKASATLGYLDLTPSLCLLCPCKEYSVDVHVATFGEKCWICSLDSELTGDFTPRQLIWKQDTTTGIVARVSRKASRHRAMTSCGISSYISSLPAPARPHLEHKLDWGHEGVETDLYEIAEQMIKWEEKLAAPLGLTAVDIHDITEGIRSLVMQRREALRRWRRKQGPRATYRNLLEIFVRAGHTQCAEAVCEVLRKKYSEASSSKQTQSSS